MGLAALSMPALLLMLTACSRGPEQATRGKYLAAWYGCGSCHQIAGLEKATGMVAPPLNGVARRAYIIGSLPNTPENLLRWIQKPQNVDARTIMPDMNIPESDARDIAAYLYTLR